MNDDFRRLWAVTMIQASALVILWLLVFPAVARFLS